MKVKEFCPREFETLLHKNGYKFHHSRGTHKTFKKEGFPLDCTYSAHGKIINRCITTRLIKEHCLI